MKNIVQSVGGFNVSQMTDIKRKRKPSQKSIFLKSASMVAGANKVFCGTENGVCELTKDTVYVHPSAKQCSWTPEANSSFVPVASFGRNEAIYLKSAVFSKGAGMYCLVWHLSAGYSSGSLQLAATIEYGYHSIHTIGRGSGTYTVVAWINNTYNSYGSISVVIDNELISDSGSSIISSTRLFIKDTGESKLEYMDTTISATVYYLNL